MSTPSAQSIKTLIVDDFRPDSDMVRSLLCSKKLSWDTNISYDCKVASTGQEGLRVMAEMLPDCILLDYNLPDMSGMEFISVARHSGQVNSVPIIVLTGARDNDSAVKSLKEGALDYLVKCDLTSDSLHKSISAALSKVALERQLQDQHEELAMFAARTSHDLVSPLNNILMYTELIGEDLDDGQTELARQKVDMLHELCTNTLVTINRLSEYARHGRSSISFQSTDLDTYVALTIRLLDAQIKKENAKISVGSMPTVMGDPIGLSLLFQNLLENALKFRSRNSLQIDIFAEELEAHWLITVRDNGIGIEEAGFDEIFRPFSRAHNRRQYGGTGLGLATCRKILWQHSGKIWVESEPGKGSTFYFTLPKGEAERATVALAEPKSYQMPPVDLGAFDID